MSEEEKQHHFWYHWSPTERRPRIKKSGLLPHQLSTDRLWRPPYVCLAAWPSMAWGLSGLMHRGQEHQSWDLWQVWLGEQNGYETLLNDRDGSVKEVRVYERIYKRNVWYVASRSHG